MQRVVDDNKVVKLNRFPIPEWKEINCIIAWTLFMATPHNRCPRTTFLNQIRCFRNNRSRASPLFHGFLRCSFISSLHLSVFVPLRPPA